MKKTFEQHLAGLNPSQRKAATTTEGNLLISAGAGTGKTGTLTAHYVATLLDMAPEDQRTRGTQGVLAITFTTAAASELNRRIRSLLRSIGRDDLARQMGDAWISTFHAFCARLLKAEAPLLVGELALDPGFSQLDELEASAVLAQAYADTFDSWAFERLDDLRQLYKFTDQDSLRQSIGQVLSLRKTYGLGLERVLADVDLKGRGGSAEDERPWRRRSHHASRCVVELARDVQGRYSELKSDLGAMDFDDLILRAYQLLSSDASVAEKYREQFDRIIIDEFQDTNHLQYRMFREISRNNLSIVGDKNQSIYAFQGAQASVFERATNDLLVESAQKGAWTTTVELGANYRSHEDILNFVNTTFASDAMFGSEGIVPLSVPDGEEHSAVHADIPAAMPSRVLVAPIGARDKTWPTCPGDIGVAASGREVQWAADWVERFRSEECGFRLSDVHVLVRRRRLGKQLAAELVSRGIPAVVLGGDGLLVDPAVRATIALLELLDNLEDDEAFIRLAISPIGRVPDQELMDVHARSRASRTDAGERLSLWGAARKRVESGTCGEDLADLVRSVELATQAIGVLPIDRVIRSVVAQRGYDLALLAPSGDDLGATLKNQQSYSNLMAFADRAREWQSAGGSLRGYLADIKQNLAAKKTLSIPETSVGRGISDAVTISTIHASKGLEYPIVMFPLGGWKYEDIGRGCSAVGVVGEEGAANSEPYVVVSTRVSLTDEEVSLASGAAVETIGMADPDLVARSKGAIDYTPQDLAQIEADWLEREIAESKRLMYVAVTRARNAVLIGYQAERSKPESVEKHGRAAWQSALEETVLDGQFPRYSVRSGLPFDLTLQEDYLLDVSVDVADWPEAEKAYTAAVQRAASCVAAGDVEGLDTSAQQGGGAPSDPRVCSAEFGSREAEYQKSSAPVSDPLLQVSASHIRAYYRCPRQYHLQYRVGAGSLRTKDPDDATNLGNALHAILERGWASQELDGDRALAILKTHRISEHNHAGVLQQARLLLGSSSIAELRGQDCRVTAEKQFYVPLGDCATSCSPGDGVFLQGYIDLYAMRVDRTARVLDYKSGHGSEKGSYETQARCYALVALREGAEAVEVRFLMPDAAEPPVGAIVDGGIAYHRFDFTSSDAPSIEREVLDAVNGMAEAGGVSEDTLKELVEFKVCASCGYAGPLCDVGAARVGSTRKH